MTFYAARQRMVRAKQWFTHGDHDAVKPGYGVNKGVLDIERSHAFSRRYIEPGDWIVSDNSARLYVLTPAEFEQQFEGLHGQEKATEVSHHSV